MQILPRDTGWIELVCGPMFSGKTEELIRRLRRAVYAKQKVEIYKPAMDTRYADVEIVSHSRQRLTARPIQAIDEVLRRLGADTEVVGIDEAQFFDDNLTHVCETLADRGLRVVVAGLDQDYRGLPFGPIPRLMVAAEYVTKSLAICSVCGNPASRSQRLISQGDRVLLGAEESYEPRCRLHHRTSNASPEQRRLFS